VSNVERGKRITELANAGEPDPDTLCDEALKPAEWHSECMAATAAGAALLELGHL
jgi:hypothetical protein